MTLLTMIEKTAVHTTTRDAARTHPNILNPGLLRAWASASVAVTRAVLGNTKEYQVIWKGKRWPGRQYFHREPTDTKKNQKLSPYTQRPTNRMVSVFDHSGLSRRKNSSLPMMDRIRTMSTAWSPSWRLIGIT